MSLLGRSCSHYRYFDASGSKQALGDGLIQSYTNLRLLAAYLGQLVDTSRKQLVAALLPPNRMVQCTDALVEALHGSQAEALCVITSVRRETIDHWR
ncbi:hypothetical protein D3C85_1294970 [compost metagenome]